MSRKSKPIGTENRLVVVWGGVEWGSQLGTVWPRGKAMHLKWSCSSYPSNVVIFGLCCPGVYFSLTPWVSGFSQWYLVYGLLLVVLLGRVI